MTPLKLVKGPAIPEGTALLTFKIGLVNQFISTYTVHAHTAEEAVSMVEEGHKDISFAGNEESVRLGAVVAEIPLGQNHRELNFTRAMMQQRQQAIEAAQAKVNPDIVIPQIVPPTGVS